MNWRRIRFKITTNRNYNDRSEEAIKSIRWAVMIKQNLTSDRSGEAIKSTRKAVMIKQNVPVTGMEKQLKA